MRRGRVTIDVRAALDNAPMTRTHWRLVLLVALVTMFDGFEVATPAYVIYYVRGAWGLSSAAAGFMVSAGLIGFALGSIGHGALADRLGRRPVLAGALALTGLASAATALFARDFSSFVALRVVTGLGMGVLLPLGTAYLNEYLPAAARNRMAALGGCGFALGAVLAPLVGIFLTPGMGWEVLFWLAALALPLAALYLRWLPESVEFLVVNGKPDAARAILARIDPALAPRLADADLVASARRQAPWREPLSRQYIGRGLLLWTTAGMLLFCIYSLGTWLPNLMIERGAGFAGGFSFGIVLNLASIVGALLGGLVADRLLGTTRATLLWCVLGAIAALLLAVTTAIPVALLAAAGTGLFLVGGQFMLNNLGAMSYPVTSRATGQGYMLGVGRLGAIVGPVIGGVLTGRFGGTAAPFYAVAVAGAIAAVSLWGLHRLEARRRGVDPDRAGGAGSVRTV